MITARHVAIAWRALLALVAAAPAGCGAGARSTAVVAPRSTAATSACPAMVAARRQRGPRGELLVLPAEPAGRRDRALWWEAAAIGETRNVVVGGLRVSVAGDALEWGDGRFVDAIVVATPTDAGWVFATEGGTVARAARFTGSLERLGGTRHALARTVQTPSRGRAALLDARGVVFTTDGRAPPAPLAALHEPALAAAFVDARRGAVVLEGGGVYATDDGGATLRPVPMGGDAALALETTATGELRVHTADGTTRTLGADGTLGAPVQVAHAIAADDEARTRFTRRLGRAMVRRDPALLARDYAAAGVARADGTLLVANGRDVRVYDRASGHEVAAHRGTLPGEHCVLRAWGEALAALCPVGDAGAVVLYHSFEGERFTDVHAGWTGAAPAFSDDELHAARLGPCPDAPAAGADGHPAPTACVFHAELGEWRALEAGDGRAVIVALHADAVLLADRDEQDRLVAPRVLHADSGAHSALRVPRAASGATWSLRTARFLADGTLVAVASAARDEGDATTADAALWIGMPEQELSVLPLPRGASAADFADADHGVARRARPGPLRRVRVRGRRPAARAGLGHPPASARASDGARRAARTGPVAAGAEPGRARLVRVRSGFTPRGE
jgi:hypothetical protein